MQIDFTAKEISLCITGLDNWKILLREDALDENTEIDERYQLFEVVGVLQALRVRLKDIGGDEVEKALNGDFAFSSTPES